MRLAVVYGFEQEIARVSLEVNVKRVGVHVLLVQRVVTILAMISSRSGSRFQWVYRIDLTPSWV